MKQKNIPKAIANDIKANEEKINHHGKRADAIVKGMLQHAPQQQSRLQLLRPHTKRLLQSMRSLKLMFA